MNAQELWVWLATALGPASMQAVQLVAYFKDIRAIYNAGDDDIRAFAEDYGVKYPERIINSLSAKDLKKSREIIKWAKSNGVGLLTLGDNKRYPKQLAKIGNMPLVLYYLGNLPDTVGRLTVAVVGTRDMTEYGKMAAYDISYRMAKAGAVIVSGLAKGVDGTAAAAALDAGGSTVAVLGSGIDVVYPREHVTLYRAVAKQGMVVTEYPPGTPPEGRNFPVRNRIISGLSRATLVIEANTTSGALITARETLKQGRDLFAIPGQIKNDSSSGTNALIRDGANAVLSSTDILEVYREKFTDTMDIYKAWSCRELTSEEVNERLKLWRVANIPKASASTEGHGVFGGRDENFRQKTAVKGANVNRAADEPFAADYESDVDETGTSYTAPVSIINYLQKQFTKSAKDGDGVTAEENRKTAGRAARPSAKKKNSPETDVDIIREQVVPDGDAVKPAGEMNDTPEPLITSASDAAEAADDTETPETSDADDTTGTSGERDTSTLSENELSVYGLFTDGDKLTADDLVNRGADAAQVNATLTMLSLRGFIEELPGGMFTLC